MRKFHWLFLILVTGSCLNMISPTFADRMAGPQTRQTARPDAGRSNVRSQTSHSSGDACPPVTCVCRPIPVRCCFPCQPCVPVACPSDMSDRQSEQESPDGGGTSRTLSPAESRSMNDSVRQYEQRRPIRQNGNQSNGGLSFSDPAPSDGSNPETSREYRHIPPPEPPKTETDQPPKPEGIEVRSDPDGFSPVTPRLTNGPLRGKPAAPKRLRFAPVRQSQSIETVNRGWIPVSESVQRR